jgi:hypothetical protein
MRKVFSVFLVSVMVLSGGCIFNTGDEGFSVSGTITTKDGTPLDGIYVSLGQTVVRTNINGYYKFTDVKFNNYFIEADPYENFTIKYRFEPGGHMIAVKADMTVNFTAYPK